VDAEQVRAAVMVALDASMDAMADEIARRVIAALQSKKAEAMAAPLPLPRVNPLGVRSSILGLEPGWPDSE
jgi:hypothetical protein